ncbi:MULTISPECIES: threonine-phosphate decarboxylase CobD [unclassified Pseudomonas]|uniref:threonine-phosphate decarboxylase CobD n=1 Tax=unclassified Pseudomonas TaxID=196821 RepID=UPI00244942DC|nr:MULTISPECIES: threonine-phosphate decarboxylase CobD [unclassified Pseudomonas]MDG9931099.1 threonine-phosphate decarboxylase CobD [Pseudomonas sp. GD04042]MDH0485566.1 threonine-phosphate decarboxylase CobD [Pseudomonas sp. GD04015]MDH0606861.1 threonine-phosphate decarboxylase CobD [Pseudomonas sp. GD03869]
MLEHGGRLREAARRYGIPLADWLDLSTGIAPYGWLLPAIPASAWQCLPEADDGLEALARDYYGAPALLPVAGSQAAIQALPRLCRDGSRVGIVSPAYAEHAEAWRREGHLVVELGEGAVERSLERLDVLLVVNPNNPTGRLIERERLLGWHARLAERGGWLLVDEAFMDCTPEHSLAADSQRPGLIVLRSFGKFFGLAGIRLGFVLAEAALLERLSELLGPWSVSGPARAVARALLGDGEGQWRQRERLRVDGLRLAVLLSACGLAPAGGTALFQLVHHPQAVGLHGYFARRGILLRLFAETRCLRFGLPGGEAGWRRLEQALKETPA